MKFKEFLNKKKKLIKYKSIKLIILLKYILKLRKS